MIVKIVSWNSDGDLSPLKLIVFEQTAKNKTWDHPLQANSIRFEKKPLNEIAIGFFSVRHR